MEVLRKYGEATTLIFPLVDRATLDFEATPVTFAAADTKISKDEGAFANTGSTPAHEGQGSYSLALTATEMQAARISIICVDVSGTKLWEDQAIIISTYGNASAQHAFDLDTAQQDVNVAAMDGNVITAAVIADGAIDAATFAAGAIDNAAIAADAIGSSEIAADAIGAVEFNASGEVAEAVWDALKASHVDVGSFGEEVQAHALEATVVALNDPTAAAIADAVWDEAAGDHIAEGSLGQANTIIHSGTAVAGTANTITLDAGASSVNNHYNQNVVFITAGLGAGQAKQISTYLGSSKICGFAINWAITPDATSVFVVLPYTIESQAIFADAVWNETLASHVTAGSMGLDQDGDVQADQLLVRNLSNVESAGFRTLYGALASLVNRAKINGSNLEIYETDDTTLLATIPITVDATQDPVVELNPP